jgi:hypothetical protein
MNRRTIAAGIEADLGRVLAAAALFAAERTSRGVSVAIPYSTTCQIRSLRAWQDEAGITEGRCSGGSGPRRAAGTVAMPPAPRRRHGVDAGTVAQVQARAARAGFDPALLGVHSLKRGPLSTGMAARRPSDPRQTARPPKSYAVLDVYLEGRLQVA